jgi:hypothetical protein
LTARARPCPVHDASLIRARSRMLGLLSVATRIHLKLSRSRESDPIGRAQPFRGLIGASTY